LSAQERPPDLSPEAQPAITLSAARILDLLSTGEIEVEGLIPWSSNATLLVTVRDGELATLAVYKPQAGERPLWDFAHGTLGMREVASFLVDDALGWGLVPPTVLRQGPHGLGSIQFFVHAQDEEHFFTFQDEPRYARDLQRLAAFDVLANNADRKAGHCLLGLDGRLWAIDNALTFHAEPKLRTVIWDFAGEPLPEDILADLRALRALLAQDSGLIQALGHLLSDPEVQGLRERLNTLLEEMVYPLPGERRSIPYPLI
jgi:uncharacterized repeat protein (TIGR03843 family)